VDKNNGNRVVFASIDIAFGTQIIKNKVMKKLSAQFGDLYTPENVALSGTHTHRFDYLILFFQKYKIL